MCDLVAFVRGCSVVLEELEKEMLSSHILFNSKHTHTYTGS